MFVATFPLVYIASIRYNVGMDYDVYRKSFDLIKRGVQINDFEILFHKLNEIVAHLGGDFRWFFAINAVIFMILIGLRIFEDSPMPTISMFLLVATTYFFSFLNGMRQMIASVILLYSLKYVREKKFLIFFSFVAVASGFHTTSWLFIIVYFIYNIESNWKRVFIYTIIIAIFASYIGKCLNNLIEFTKYSKYLTSVYADREQGYISLLIGVLVLVFASVYYDKNDKTYQLYYKLQIIGVWISLLIPYVPLINRVRWMFGLPIIILIPKTISKITDQEIRVLITYLIVILYAIYCGYNLIVYNTNQVLPYQTIFSIIN